MTFNESGEASLTQSDKIINAYTQIAQDISAIGVFSAGLRTSLVATDLANPEAMEAHVLQIERLIEAISSLQDYLID